MKDPNGDISNQIGVGSNDEADNSLNIINVLIADHNPLTRLGMVALLDQQTDFEVVGKVHDSESAVQAAASLLTDLVIINRNLPNKGYLKAVSKIRNILPIAKVVVVVDQQNDAELERVIRVGGHGYLTSDITPNSLFQIFRGVMRGEAAVSRRSMGDFLRKFSEQTSLVDDRPLSVFQRLHPREREVLALLVNNGASNKKIAQALGIAENTVKNHLKSIIEKLKVKNRGQAAIFASQNGFF